MKVDIAIVASVVLLVAAAIWAGTAAEDECERRGGRMVDDGAPTYVPCGHGMMCPVRGERCEVKP